MIKIPKNELEMNDLIADLLVRHFAQLSNEKHMNSTSPTFPDHWGVERDHRSNSVLVEIQEDLYDILIRKAD